MKKYYIHEGNNQQGPFDYEDLRAKGVTAKTKIWYEGINDWIDAEQCEELKELFKISTPPPLIKKNDTKSRNKPSKTWSIIRYCVIGVIILIFLIALLRNNQDSSYSDKVMTIEEIEIAQPTNFLSVEGEYNENFWGDKINLNCTVTNKATVAAYKDLVLRVTYYTKTKTYLGSKDFTVY